MVLFATLTAEPVRQFENGRQSCFLLFEYCEFRFLMSNKYTVTTPINANKNTALHMIGNNTSTFCNPLLNDDPYKFLFSSVIFKTSGKLALHKSLSLQQPMTFL